MSQATAKEVVDGSKALDQQETDLNTIEQVWGGKTTRYAKGSSGTSNRATIQLLGLSDPQPPMIQLILATQETPAGSDKVFQSTVFVEGVEKNVVGYRPQ
jgi:hypothetical protein